MNPTVGLQTGYVPNTVGLMRQQATPSTGGLMSQVPSLQASPGDWSSVAYNMAGRPNQGPYATPAALPMPAGVSNGSQSSGGAIGGTALGLLGALAKNPSLLKSAANGISSLFGGGTAGLPADAAAGINSAAVAGLEPVGTGAVGGAVDAASADAAAALSGTDAAGGATAFGADAAVAPAAGTGASGGLMAGGDAAAAADSGAAGSGAAGLSPALGGTAAVGLALAPALYGMSRKPVDYSAQWTQNAINSVQNMLKGGINDSNVGQVPQLLALSDVPGLSQYTDQLRSAYSNYSNSLMNQRAAASGFTRAQLDAAGGGNINSGGSGGGGKRV